MYFTAKVKCLQVLRSHKSSVRGAGSERQF